MACTHFISIRPLLHSVYFSLDVSVGSREGALPRRSPASARARRLRHHHRGNVGRNPGLASSELHGFNLYISGNISKHSVHNFENHLAGNSNTN